MATFAVHYTYTDATAAGRDEYRPAHREWLRGQVEAGRILSTGAYPDGTGALIIVTASDVAAATDLMAVDPFLLAGVVDAVRVVEWRPVMGAFAE